LLAEPLRAQPSEEAAGLASCHRPEAYSARLPDRWPLAAGLAAVAVFLWWATEEGGYPPTAWYPGAVFFLALLGVVLGLNPTRATISSSWTRRAVVLFAAFSAWSFLSLLWAGVRGDAWDGANRTLLYFTVYSLFALLSWRARDGAVVLALFALGIALVGATDLVVEGGSAFIDGRLAGPTGYANASAALFLIAFWPALSLAARPEVHWAARGVLLAAAGVLVQLAVLAQSRGSVPAGAVALAAYVVLARPRLRALFVLLPVAAVTLASLEPLLSIFASGSEAAFEAALGREQQALALSTVALLVIGAVIGLVDRPSSTARAREPGGRRRRVLLATIAAGAALAALAAVAALNGLPSTSGSGASSGPTSPLGSSRFGEGLETGRFDMWRVAAQTVADHPALGVGADNFAVDFARERETREEPLYPHSLVLRAFSQTGLVGGVLFLGFAGAAFMAAARRREQTDGLAQAIVAGSVASAVYWFVHGSIDWLWEIPVLAAAALAFLGLAAALQAPRASRPQSGPNLSLRGRWVAAALGVAALGSYLLPGLAASELERAVAAWPAEPDGASSRLDWARRLNPLSERAAVVAGTLAQRAGERDRARAAFEEAVARNPNDWYVHLRIALLDAAAGRRAEALIELERAEVLNPLEPTIQAAKNELLAGQPVPQQLLLQIDRLAVRSPLGRRPVDCHPILGIASSCT
jgi:tetratricopeptide (TPR) repeat protein